MSAKVHPHLAVACPYCKAKPGEACSIDRRTVCVAVHGVHKPRRVAGDKLSRRAAIERARKVGG